MILKAKKKVVGAVVAALAALGLLTGCGHDNFKDVKGVPNKVPDLIVNYENMDGHPNLGLVCIKGAGFLTTTRDYTAVQRVPEWDDFCRKQPEHG